MKRSRFAGAIAALTWITMALARDAYASCIPATSCICTGSTAVLSLTIASLNGPRTTLSVTAVQAASDAGAFASEVTLARKAGDTPGARWLALVAGGSVARRLPIDASGNVACDTTSPPFVLPASQATQIALSPDCDSQLLGLGLKQPPCNDVHGCGYGAGTPLTGLLVVAALAFLLASRRRLSHRRLGAERAS